MADKFDKKSSSAPPNQGGSAQKPQKDSVSYTRPSKQGAIGSFADRMKGVFSNRTTAIFAVIVLTIGIGAATLAVQRSTETRQRAAITPVSYTFGDSSSVAVGSPNFDATSITNWQPKVSPGSNQIILVNVSIKVNTVTTLAPTVNSITYGGRQLTKLGSKASDNRLLAFELWFLKNPPQGQNSMVVNVSRPSSIVAGSMTFSNVDQTNPFGQYLSYFGSGAVPPNLVYRPTTQGLTVGAGDMMVDAITSYRIQKPCGYTAGPNQILAWGQGSTTTPLTGSYNQNGFSNDAAGGFARTPGYSDFMQWIITNCNDLSGGNIWIYHVTALRAAGSTPIATPTPTLPPTPTPTTPPPAGSKPPPCNFPASILTQLGLPTNTVRGYGDVDLDGYVSSTDSQWIADYLANLRTFSSIQTEAADVNGLPNVLSTRSNVDIGDSQTTARYLSGASSTFNVCATVTPTPTPKDLLVVAAQDGDTQATLTGVSISGTQTGTSGVTTYRIASSNSISTTLTAPASVNGKPFNRWGGATCTSATGTQCTINVPNTNIVPVTIVAVYKNLTSTPTPTPPSGSKPPPCNLPASILTQLGLPTNTVRGYGDVDLDGDVDSNDYLLILRFVAKLNTPTSTQIEVGDVDTAWGILSGSSSITDTDSLMIQRYLANLPILTGYPGAGTVGLPVCAGQPTITPTITPTPGYSITGTIFIDNNRNGTQDSGDAVYTSGATISRNGSGSPLTTVSNSSGNYSFQNLNPISYIITLTVPSGYVDTTNNPRTSVILSSTRPTWVMDFGIAPTVTSISTPTKTPTPTPRPINTADINRDGVVDLIDFNLWLRAFQKIDNPPYTANNKPYYPDVNTDSAVDLLDFNLWLIAYKGV